MVTEGGLRKQPLCFFAIICLMKDNQDNPDRIVYFAETDFRNKRQKFGIRARDRDRHMYVIGKTGMGKSTMLENMAIQDIQDGAGLGFIDPHGGSAELLLDHIPKSRIKDVIYFAPFDSDFPISFNIMEDVGKDQRHLVADGLMAAFKKIWPDVWSARMEYILNNILLALIEYPDSTILGVNRMLADKDYRDAVVAHITDPAVHAFWVDEFARYTDRYMQEAGAAIQNKIGQFVSSPVIRNIIGQVHSSFDFREAMDTKKILIMNLSKGRMGENNAALLGGMLITKIYLAAMSRANLSRNEIEGVPTFYFYVDEFQSFVNDSFANILAEARKYKLALTIAHQYVEQMPETVSAAVFGNVGTTIAFRVGPLDAELLEKIFAPKFTVEDVVNLGRNQIYLSLMIDGIGSQPFSALTLPPIPALAQTFKSEIIDHSRKTYAHEREAVEKDIKIWHESAAKIAPGVVVVASPSPPSANPWKKDQKKEWPKQGNRPVGVTPPNSTRSSLSQRHSPIISPSSLRPRVSPNVSNRPSIPREALADLGSSNLKSLIENAIKESGKELPESENENEHEGDEGMIYKPDAHSNQHSNQPDLGPEQESGLEAESETISTTSSLPHHPEIPTDELRKLLNLKQKLDK